MTNEITDCYVTINQRQDHKENKMSKNNLVVDRKSGNHHVPSSTRRGSSCGRYTDPELLQSGGPEADDVVDKMD
jgi:hypothetical protein